MNEEYEYSKYTTLCIMSICPVSGELRIYWVHNRTSQATTRYEPERCVYIPLDFYYNKDSGHIIYGSLMLQHYKKYPPHEHYVNVSNFLEDLYKLYQRSCNGNLATQDDDDLLSSAITSFLTKAYPSWLTTSRQISTTQYAFILPSHKYLSKHFIDTTFRPLLQKTPWRTLKDSPSKLVFCTKMDTHAYCLNEAKKQQPDLFLERERKYLSCTLQTTKVEHQLTMTIRFIRAVYDPDLIAASGRSMTALGGNVMLSSKLVSQPLSLNIPIEPMIAKMDRLAELLYQQVFAGKEEDVSPTQLDKYHTDSYSNSLIHQLIYSILTSKSRVVELQDTWSKKIDVHDFTESASWNDTLSEISRIRLSGITYGDIMQLFDDVDVSSAENQIERYLEEHDDEELFQSIVVVENSDDNRLDFVETTPYKIHNMVFAKQHCQGFYLLRIQKTVIDFLERQKKSKGTKGASISPKSMARSFASKILKMVRLSNRLRRPVVIKAVGETKQQESRQAPASQKQKPSLLYKIQPYGYYVQANISCSNEIKVSLNQVIETAAEDGKLQRSTLPIQDSSNKAPEMYGFIFDALWSNMDEHFTDLQCKSEHDYESAVDFGNYDRIRTEMIDAIKSSIEKKPCFIPNLDEVIYHLDAKHNGIYDFKVTHRIVMDIGLRPYLRRIAGEILASLECNAMFGNYDVSCLLVTGKFLYKWLEQGSSTYGEYAWSQLQQAINSGLMRRQFRTYLAMEKPMVLDDNDFNYKPLSLQKYRRVFGKQFWLKIEASYIGENLHQLYQDKGDHWTKIPFTNQTDNFLTWTVPLLSIERSECLLEDSFYFIIGSEDYGADEHALFCDMKLLVLSAADLDCIDAALDSRMNVALITYLFSLESSVETIKTRCTFPFEVKIMPCSRSSAIDLKMRMGIDSTAAKDPLEYEHIAYSEKLTLERI